VLYRAWPLVGLTGRCAVVPEAICVKPVPLVVTLPENIGLEAICDCVLAIDGVTFDTPVITPFWSKVNDGIDVVLPTVVEVTLLAT
jgi:hypothetical protein